MEIRFIYLTFVKPPFRKQDFAVFDSLTELSKERLVGLWLTAAREQATNGR